MNKKWRRKNKNKSKGSSITNRVDDVASKASSFITTTFTTPSTLLITHLLNLQTLITQNSISLIQYVKNLFVFLMMLVGQQLSAKKEARLRNKQNKLAAEYRLVTGKEEDGGGNQGGEDGAGGKRRKLEGDDFKAMKSELAERKRNLVQIPRFRISSNLPGLNASVYLQEYSTRTPLLLSDIQHLITYAYGGNELVPPPSRWCYLQKPNRLMQIVVLIVDGVGLNEFVDNESAFSRTMTVFGGTEEDNRGIFEVLDPRWYGENLFGEVGRWGILGGYGTNIKKVDVKMEGDEESTDTKDITSPQLNFEAILNQLRSVFPIEKGEEKEGKKSSKLPSSDKFSRTSLVLTLPKLIYENYPLPIPANTLTRNTTTGYTLTSASYAPVTSRSKMFSIDCEMVEAVGDPNALIRVGVVDEKLETVYESLVKPETKVVDYRTRWSGVNAGMMEGVDVKLADVQAKLMDVVEANPGCIFVGQSLNCDLKALRLLHPYIIDTSTIFNLTGIAGRKSSLKDLSLSLLDEIIQDKKTTCSNNNSKLQITGDYSNNKQQQGHHPVEDARAAMKLVKAKLANGYSFGNTLIKADENGCAIEDGDTLVCVEEPIVKSQLTSCRNKMTKNVFIVSQQDPESFPFSTSASEPDTTNPQAKLTPNLIKTNSTSKTNGSVVKLMYTNFLESLLTVGFYKLSAESESYHKTLGKLDKRLEKLYNRMCLNSLMVVMGCGNNADCDSSSSGSRRNNGVCFVRLKVDEGVRKRGGTAARKDY